MSVFKRIAFAAIVLFLLLVGTAQAIPLNGVPDVTLDVLNYQPNLAALVLSVFPNFHVLPGGGAAYPGYMYVTVRLTGQAYTDQVAHEWAHEIQIASDRTPHGLSAAWYGYLESYFGWQVPEQVSYSLATHWLAENIAGYFFYPYARNDCGYSFGYQTMRSILECVGVTP